MADEQTESAGLMHMGPCAVVDSEYRVILKKKPCYCLKETSNWGGCSLCVLESVARGASWWGMSMHCAYTYHVFFIYLTFNYLHETALKDDYVRENAACDLCIDQLHLTFQTILT